MPRDTIAMRAARAARATAEAEARQKALSVPATITDVRSLQWGLRSEFQTVVDKRNQLIENLRWFARNLITEADYLAADPDREPSTSICTGSLPHDIDRLAAEVNAMVRVLRPVIRELAEQGVPLAGLSVTDGKFGGSVTLTED